LFLKNLNPVRRIRELMVELGRTRRERDQARQQVEQLEDERQRLHEKLEHLREENERLRNELEAAMRVGKRQLLHSRVASRRTAPNLLAASPVGLTAPTINGQSRTM